MCYSQYTNWFHAPQVDAQENRPQPAKSRRDASVSARRVGLIVLGRRTTWPMLCAASDGHPTRTCPRDSPGVSQKERQVLCTRLKLDEGGYLRTMAQNVTSLFYLTVTPAPLALSLKTRSDLDLRSDAGSLRCVWHTSFFLCFWRQTCSLPEGGL